MSYNGPPPSRVAPEFTSPAIPHVRDPLYAPRCCVPRPCQPSIVAESSGSDSGYWWMLLPLLFCLGCGLPSADVSPVKPLGADAAHVIPAATREYNAGLADVYEGLANRVENGELKTVRDAATVAVSEDQRLRTEYKRALGDVMETRLGGDELPSDAPAFFREMSAAFRGMSK